MSKYKYVEIQKWRAETATFVTNEKWEDPRVRHSSDSDYHGTALIMDGDDDRRIMEGAHITLLSDGSMATGFVQQPNGGYRKERWWICAK